MGGKQEVGRGAVGETVAEAAFLSGGKATTTATVLRTAIATIIATATIVMTSTAVLDILVLKAGTTIMN
jgi:hypothetical protein